MVGKADLARPRIGTAPDQCNVRDGVVRGAERTRRQQARTRGHQTRHRVNGGDRQRFVEGQRRHHATEPSRHHRLARSGRADHERVMTARCRNLERAPRHRLAVDVSEVAIEGWWRHVGTRRRLRLLEPVRLVECRHRFRKRSHTVQAEPADDSRFGVVGPGQEEGANVVAPGGRGHRQNAARSLYPAIE